MITDEIRLAVLGNSSHERIYSHEQVSGAGFHHVVQSYVKTPVVRVYNAVTCVMVVLGQR